MEFFLRTYRYLSSRKWLLWTALACIAAILAVGVSKLRFNEDITDFLPLSDTEKQSMELYRQLSEADRIMVIFEHETKNQVSGTKSQNLDELLDAVDEFASLAAEFNPTTQIDIDEYITLTDSIYANIPYFLTDEDYTRIDSLITAEAIAASIANDKQMLQMPLSGMASEMIKNDPLRLFVRRVEALRDFAPALTCFDNYDGYLLTTDHSRAIAYLTSPYGAQETKHNGALVDTLQTVCNNIAAHHPGISVRMLGAPVIAVQNARQIKHDSILALGLSGVLIAIIMLMVFRRRKRSILLIALTIAFGWLCGMAALGFIHGHTSLIIIGIGSTIIGIAVNYPLHLVLHSHYTNNAAENLREELNPLIIGNITTVGAFLSLLPLSATAMRDLGIFATAMLLGTILFTIIALPQMMKADNRPIPASDSDSTEGDSIRRSSINRRADIAGLLIILLGSAAMAYLGRNLTFDSNLSNINYMTDGQREDFRFFEQLTKTDRRAVQVYVPHYGNSWKEASGKAAQTVYNDNVSVRSVTHYLPSTEEQEHRLQLWENFWAARRDDVLRTLGAEVRRQGFSTKLTERFEQLTSRNFAPRNWEFFRPMAEAMFKGYYVENNEQGAKNKDFVIIDKLEVAPENVKAVEQQYAGSFDVASLNSRVASSLADNFNYLGIVCSVIVFVFLWFSLKRFWYAVIAFVPMLLSWCWIFGLMSVFGLQFNVVNVILATFIFGQGDDYTIFVVEGLIYEHETGKKILPLFRREILLSAVVMLLGIGVLVLAKHPAMFSLGAVTLIGMSSVVVMAFIVPPVLFRLYHRITANCKTH